MRHFKTDGGRDGRVAVADWQWRKKGAEVMPGKLDFQQLFIFLLRLLLSFLYSLRLQLLFWAGEVQAFVSLCVYCPY